MFMVIYGAGRAHRHHDGEEQTLGFFDVGEQFGANALLDDPSYRRPRSVSVSAQSDMGCIVIDPEALGRSFEQVVDILGRDVANRHWRLMHWGKVDFEDLLCGKTIGSGTYGHVTKSLQMSRKNLYAVKAVAKTKLKSALNVRQTLNERALMAACNHPFICRLVGGFQCNHNLYFLSEMIEGGELFDALSEHGSFSLEGTLFYSSNIIAALTHLHLNGVCHRDLKTENVLVDSDGYLKLIDFGFAKFIGHAGRTNSFCGTPHYMAPELITFQPHGLPVDMWSMGCMIYEFLFGHLPFEDPIAEEGVLEIFKRVVDYKQGRVTLEQSLKLPMLYRFTSRRHWEVIDLISGLLAANPSARPTATVASNHACLIEYPLLQVEKKMFKAPFGPDLDEDRHDALLGGATARHNDYKLVYNDPELAAEGLPSDVDRVKFEGFVTCAGWGEELVNVKHLLTEAADDEDDDEDDEDDGVVQQL